HRGQRNEPGWVALVAQELAKVWGVGLEEVAQQTTRNALELFEPNWSGTMNPLYA
ncbi:MAG: TatD family hydrolase, partial [Bacteroidia bacterium]